MKPWGPFIGIVVVILILAVFVGLIVAGSGEESPDINPSTVIVPGLKVGNNEIKVVGVDVNGRNVPCVLYDGYESVAIDCLPELLP